MKRNYWIDIQYLRNVSLQSLHITGLINFSYANFLAREVSFSFGFASLCKDEVSQKRASACLLWSVVTSHISVLILSVVIAIIWVHIDDTFLFKRQETHSTLLLNNLIQFCTKSAINLRWVHKSVYGHFYAAYWMFSS